MLGPVSIMDRDPDSYTDEEHGAATKIEGMIRSKFARDKVREICRQEFEQGERERDESVRVLELF